MRQAIRTWIFFATLTSAALAQTGGVGNPSNAPGTPAASYALSGIDSVNYYNGHVNVSIPIRALGVGRGSAVRTAVAGVDRVWSSSTLQTGTVPSSDLQPPSASVYALGSLRANFHSGNPYACPYYDQEGQVQYRGLGPFTTTMTWYTGNGTEVELLDLSLNGQQQGAEVTDCAQLQAYQPANRGRVFRSTDGTDTIFVADADVIDGQTSGLINGKLILRDGTKFTFGFDSYLTQVEDRNGNLLRFVFSRTDSGGIYGVSDVLNRSETINFTECLNGCYAPPDTQDIFDHPGANGSRRQRVVNYAPLSSVLSAGESLQTYQALFPELAGSSSQTYNPFVISSVALPDGTAYTMQYNAYGELTRLQLPTGGVYSYCYAEAYRATACASNPSSGVVALTDGAFSIVRRVLERDEYADGVNLSARMTLQWSGAAANLDARHPARPGTVAEVNMLDAGGSLLRREKHFFYGDPASTQPPPADGSQYAGWWLGLEFRTETGDNNGTLQTKQTVWGQRPCGPGEACWYDPQAESAPAHDPQPCQVTTTLDDGTASTVVLAYDSAQQPDRPVRVRFRSGPGGRGGVSRRARRLAAAYEIALPDGPRLCGPEYASGQPTRGKPYL